MKKLFLISLAFCICLSLSACVATDPNNLFEITETPVDTTVSSTDETQPKPDDVILYQGIYQYGNMQKNLPSGDFLLFGNEVLFVRDFDIGFLVCSYDLISGDVGIYCKDATCKHDTCVAGTLTWGMEVYEGKLYGVNSGTSDAQILVAEGDNMKTILNAGGLFSHDEGNLYIRTADSSLMVLEKGEKEPRMLLEEYTGYWLTIFGNYLYATTNSDITRVDLTAEEPKEEVVVPNAGGMTDGEHIYYIDRQTTYLYRCAMDGSNPELLVEQPVLLASINFDEEYFYYRLLTDQKLNGTPDSCDIYRFPKDDPSKIEKIVTLPVSAYQVFTVPGTGKIFVKTHALEGEERPLYVMNADGSDPKIVEIPE